MNIGLIRNGNRKLKGRAHEAWRLLHQEDCELTLYKTERRGHAIELAKEAAKKHDVVVAFGGDGTGNEVVNGLMRTNYQGKFAVIPSGTGNDFVTGLGEFDPVVFVRKLKAGDGGMIDLGKVIFPEGHRYFLNISDVGFGACVIEHLESQRRKGLKGKMSYNLAIVRTFFSYRKPKIKAVVNGETIEEKMLMITFCNGPMFGHGLYIFPEAKIDDGILGATVIGDISIWEYLKNLKRLKKGIRIDHPRVRYLEFTVMDLFVDGDGVETDGEFVGNGPVRVQIVPQALFLIH